MNIEELRTYCLDKKGVTESFPFDETTLVFKVKNKMFAIIGLEKEPKFINLKCDPERSVQLREAHGNAIIPGYHMNKKLWNSVYFDDLSSDFVKELVDHSYELIVASLTRKLREELAKL